MKKIALPVFLLTLVLLSAACGSEKAAKPKMLKKPDLTGFSYYVIDSGMTVNLEFKDKLEIDSLTIDYALVTSAESGEGTTISKTVKTTGKKLELKFDRSYFKDDVFYASMVAGEMQYPVKLFRMQASPLRGKTVLERGKKNEGEFKTVPYIDQRVEKKPDGFLFTNVFEQSDFKSYKLF